MRGARVSRCAAVFACLWPFATALAAPRVTDVRIGEHPGYRRLVVEFAEEVPVVARELPGEAGEALVLQAGASLESPRSFGKPRTRMGVVRIEPTAEGMTLRVDGARGELRMFRLFQPPRLVIDFADRALELPEGAAPVPVAPRPMARESGLSPEPEVVDMLPAAERTRSAELMPEDGAAPEPAAEPEELVAERPGIDAALPAGEPSVLPPGEPDPFAEELLRSELPALPDRAPSLGLAERDPFALPEGTRPEARVLAPEIPAEESPSASAEAPAPQGDALPPTGAAPQPLRHFVRWAPGGAALLLVLALVGALAFLLGRRRTQLVPAHAAAASVEHSPDVIAPDELQAGPELTARLERRLDEEIRERRRLEARLAALYEEQKVLRDRMARIQSRDRSRTA